MNAKDKIKENPEEIAKPLTKEAEFKSSFKLWIRVVAFLVVAVFLPEQVAQAVEYDWRVLWNKPAVYSPTYLKDINAINIPLAIKKILLDVSGKPVTAIKISPTLTVELEKPLNLSRQRIEEIYKWLEGKPCGSKALYEFLNYKGMQVQEQDIAVMALTVDILNGVVQPVGNPEIIKNSLYALSKTSEFFGSKLYPVKIDLAQGTIPELPFIAHLKSEHYILVTRITDEKVYYIEDHKEEFLPRENFLKKFSGFALISNSQLPAPSSQLLSDSEAKAILGARSYKGQYADLSNLFEEPEIEDVAIAGLTQIALNIGTSALSLGLGALCQGLGPIGSAIGGMAGGALGGYATGGGEGALYGAIGGGIGGGLGGYVGSEAFGSSAGALGGGIGAAAGGFAGGYLGTGEWTCGIGSGLGAGLMAYSVGKSAFNGQPFSLSGNLSNAWSAVTTGAANNLPTYMSTFGMSFVMGQVGQAATLLAAREFGWSPEASQLFGMAFSSGLSYSLSAGMSLLGSATTSTTFSYEVPLYNDWSTSLDPIGTQTITSRTPLNIQTYTPAGSTINVYPEYAVPGMPDSYLYTTPVDMLTPITPQITTATISPQVTLNGKSGVFKYAPEFVQQFVSDYPFVARFAYGAAIGLAQGALQIELNKAFGDKMDSTLKYGLSSLISAGVTNVGFNALMGAIPGGDYNAWDAIKNSFSANNYQLAKYMITQGVGLGFEYFATKQGWMDPEYSRLLGQGLGGALSSFLPQTDQVRWFNLGLGREVNAVTNSMMDGLVNAGVSIGLTKLVNATSDKSPLNASMPYLTMLGSAAVFSAYHSIAGTDLVLVTEQSNGFDKLMTREQAEKNGYTDGVQIKAADFGDIALFKLRNAEIDYMTFGRTSPNTPSQYLQGEYSTFNFALYNSKTWDFNGLTYYADSANRLKEQLRKEGGDPDDWRKYDILPTIAQSLVFYGRSWAHAQAANMLTDLGRDIYADAGGSRLGAYKTYFGIPASIKDSGEGFAGKTWELLTGQANNPGWQWGEALELKYGENSKSPTVSDRNLSIENAYGKSLISADLRGIQGQDNSYLVGFANNIGPMGSSYTGPQLISWQFDPKNKLQLELRSKDGNTIGTVNPREANIKDKINELSKKGELSPNAYFVVPGDKQYNEDLRQYGDPKLSRVVKDLELSKKGNAFIPTEVFGKDADEKAWMQTASLRQEFSPQGKTGNWDYAYKPADRTSALYLAHREGIRDFSSLKDYAQLEMTKPVGVAGYWVREDKDSVGKFTLAGAGASSGDKAIKINEPIPGTNEVLGVFEDTALGKYASGAGKKSKTPDPDSVVPIVGVALEGPANLDLTQRDALKKFDSPQLFWAGQLKDELYVVTPAGETYKRYLPQEIAKTVLKKEGQNIELPKGPAAPKAEVSPETKITTQPFMSDEEADLKYIAAKAAMPSAVPTAAQTLIKNSEYKLEQGNAEGKNNSWVKMTESSPVDIEKLAESSFKISGRGPVLISDETGFAQLPSGKMNIAAGNKVYLPSGGMGVLRSFVGVQEGTTIQDKNRGQVKAGISQVQLKPNSGAEGFGGVRTDDQFNKAYFSEDGRLQLKDYATGWQSLSSRQILDSQGAPVYWITNPEQENLTLVTTGDVNKPIRATFLDGKTKLYTGTLELEQRYLNTGKIFSVYTKYQDAVKANDVSAIAAAEEELKPIEKTLADFSGRDTAATEETFKNMRGLTDIKQFESSLNWLLDDKKVFADFEKFKNSLPDYFDWAAIAIYPVKPGEKNPEFKDGYKAPGGKEEGDFSPYRVITLSQYNIRTDASGKFNYYQPINQLETLWLNQPETHVMVFNSGVSHTLPAGEQEVKFMTDRWTWLSKDSQTRGGITVGLDGTPFGWADTTVSRVAQGTPFSWTNSPKQDVLSLNKIVAGRIENQLIAVGHRTEISRITDLIKGAAQDGLSLEINGQKISFTAEEISQIKAAAEGRMEEAVGKLVADKIETKSELSQTWKDYFGNVGLEAVRSFEKANNGSAVIEFDFGEEKITFDLVKDLPQKKASYAEAAQYGAEQLLKGLPESIRLEATLKIKGQGDLLWGEEGLDRVYSGYKSPFNISEGNLIVKGFVGEDKKVPPLFSWGEKEDENSRIALRVSNEGKFDFTAQKLPYFTESHGTGNAGMHDLTLGITKVKDASGKGISLPINMYEVLRGEGIPLGISLIEPGFYSEKYVGAGVSLNNVLRAKEYVVGEGGAYFNDPTAHRMMEFKEGDVIRFIQSEKDRRGMVELAGGGTRKAFFNEVNFAFGYDGSPKLAFQYLKAGAELEQAIIGQKLEKGRSVILRDAEGVWLKTLDKDTTVAELLKDEPMDARQFARDNFAIWKPSDLDDVGFSALFVEGKKAGDTAYAALPLIGKTWTKESGLVAQWGGGDPDFYFDAGSLNPLYNDGKKHEDIKRQEAQPRNSISAEEVINAVRLPAGGKINGQFGIIENLSVYGMSDLGEGQSIQRRIGYGFNLGNPALTPTLGMPGTKFDNPQVSEAIYKEALPLKGEKDAAYKQRLEGLHADLRKEGFSFISGDGKKFLDERILFNGSMFVTPQGALFEKGTSQWATLMNVNDKYDKRTNPLVRFTQETLGKFGYDRGFNFVPASQFSAELVRLKAETLQEHDYSRPQVREALVNVARQKGVIEAIGKLSPEKKNVIINGIFDNLVNALNVERAKQAQTQGKPVPQLVDKKGLADLYRDKNYEFASFLIQDLRSFKDNDLNALREEIKRVAPELGAQVDGLNGAALGQKLLEISLLTSDPQLLREKTEYMNTFLNTHEDQLKSAQAYLDKNLKTGSVVFREGRTSDVAYVATGEDWFTPAKDAGDENNWDWQTNAPKEVAVLGSMAQKVTSNISKGSLTTAVEINAIDFGKYNRFSHAALIGSGTYWMPSSPFDIKADYARQPEDKIETQATQVASSGKMQTRGIFTANDYFGGVLYNSAKEGNLVFALNNKGLLPVPYFMGQGFKWETQEPNALPSLFWVRKEINSPKTGVYLKEDSFITNLDFNKPLSISSELTKGKGGADLELLASHKPTIARKADNSQELLVSHKPYVSLKNSPAASSEPTYQTKYTNVAQNIVLHKESAPVVMQSEIGKGSLKGNTEVKDLSYRGLKFSNLFGNLVGDETTIFDVSGKLIQNGRADDIIGWGSKQAFVSGKRAVIEDGFVTKGRLEFDGVSLPTIFRNIDIRFQHWINNAQKKERDPNEPDLSRPTMTRQGAEIIDVSDTKGKIGFRDLTLDGTHLFFYKGLDPNKGMVLTPTLGEQFNIMATDMLSKAQLGKLLGADFTATKGFEGNAFVMLREERNNKNEISGYSYEIFGDRKDNFIGPAAFNDKNQNESRIKNDPWLVAQDPNTGEKRLIRQSEIKETSKVYDAVIFGPDGMPLDMPKEKNKIALVNTDKGWQMLSIDSAALPHDWSTEFSPIAYALIPQSEFDRIDGENKKANAGGAYVLQASLITLKDKKYYVLPVDEKKLNSPMTSGTEVLLADGKKTISDRNLKASIDAFYSKYAGTSSEYLGIRIPAAAVRARLDTFSVGGQFGMKKLHDAMAAADKDGNIHISAKMRNLSRVKPVGPGFEDKFGAGLNYQKVLGDDGVTYYIRTRGPDSDDTFEDILEDFTGADGRAMGKTTVFFSKEVVKSWDGDWGGTWKGKTTEDLKNFLQKLPDGREGYLLVVPSGKINHGGDGIEGILPDGTKVYVGKNRPFGIAQSAFEDVLEYNDEHAFADTKRIEIEKGKFVNVNRDAEYAAGVKEFLNPAKTAQVVYSPAQALHMDPGGAAGSTVEAWIPKQILDADKAGVNKSYWQEYTTNNSRMINGAEYVRLLIPGEKLLHNSGDGWLNLGHNDIEVMIETGSGPAPRYIDGGYGSIFGLGKSTLRVAMESVTQEIDGLKFLGSFYSGINRNNYLIGAGENTYYVDGASLEPYMMSLLRRHGTGSEYSSVITGTTSEMMDRNAYADKLYTNSIILAADAAATLTLAFLPTFGASQTAAVGTGAKTINLGRKLLGLYKTSTNLEKALQVSRFALGQGNLWGGGITGYSEVKSLIGTGEWMDPLAATDLFINTGTEAALYSLGFEALGPISRAIAGADSAIAKGWKSALGNTGNKLEDAVTIGRSSSRLSTYAANAVLDLPTNLITGATLGAGRAVIDGVSPLSKDFWLGNVLPSAGLFALVNPALQTWTKARADKKFDNFKDIINNKPAESIFRKDPTGYALRAANSFYSRTSQNMFNWAGGLTVAGAGTSDQLTYHPDKDFSYTRLAMDFLGGWLGTAAASSLFRWNSAYNANRYNPLVMAEGQAGQKLLWNAAKRWVWQQIPIKIGGIETKLPWSWAGTWLAGDLAIDIARNNDWINNSWTESLHNINNVVGLWTFSRAFNTPRVHESNSGMRALFDLRNPEVKKAWQAFWKDPTSVARMDAFSRWTAEGLVLPIRGGNAIEWGLTGGWIFGGRGLLPEGKKYDDIHTAVSMFMLGGKLFGLAGNNFSHIQQEWFGATNRMHPWLMTANMVQEGARLVPQLAGFMSVFPHIQNYFFDNPTSFLSSSFDVESISGAVRLRVLDIREMDSPAILNMINSKGLAGKRSFTEQLMRDLESGDAQKRELALGRAKEALINLYLDEEGLSGLKRRALSLGLDPLQTFWQLEKETQMEELKMEYEAASGLQKKYLAEKINELSVMSLTEFKMHNMATAAWEGAKVAITFGPTMYFIRPLLAPGLSSIPGIADIQGILGEDVMKDSIVSWETKGMSKPAAFLSNRILAAQDFFVEEQVREQLATIMFLRPVFDSMGGIAQSPSRADFSNYREYMAAQAMYQQVMEWFQESFEKGISISSANRRMNRFTPFGPDAGVSDKSYFEVKRYIDDNLAEGYNPANLPGASSLNISNDRTIAESANVVMVSGLESYTGLQGTVDIATGTIYVDAGLAKDTSRSSQLSEVINHEVGELKGHRAEATQRGIAYSDYAEQFLMRHADRQEVIQTVQRIHGNAAPVSGASKVGLQDAWFANSQACLFDEPVIDIQYPKGIGIDTSKDLDKEGLIYGINHFNFLSVQEQMKVLNSLANIKSGEGEDKAFLIMGKKGQGTFEEQRILLEDKIEKDNLERIEITDYDNRLFEMMSMKVQMLAQRGITTQKDKDNNFDIPGLVKLATTNSLDTSMTAAQMALWDKLGKEDRKKLLAGQTIEVDGVKIKPDIFTFGFGQAMAEDETGVASDLFRSPVWEQGTLKQTIRDNYAQEVQAIKNSGADNDTKSQQLRDLKKNATAICRGLT